MRTLYQFPLSPFCEKARWLLDYKQLDYVAQNLTYGLHTAYTRIKTGQSKLPFLKEDQQYIDGNQLSLYLDRKYPEHPVLRTQRSMREKIKEFEILANTLGDYTQTIIYSRLNKKQELDLFLGEFGYLQRFKRISRPIVSKILTHTADKQIDTAITKIKAIIVDLNEHIIAQKGKYLVGDRLTVADISICAMLAPLLNLVGTPWESEDHTPCEIFQLLHSLPLGQYIIRIYATQRNARVDWRGV